MPNIRVYNAEVGALRPTETGVEATAAAARRSGGFFNQAAESRNQIAGATRQLASETRALGEEEAASGRQFASMVAGGIKGAGEVAVDYAQHREISHGAPAYAGLNDALTQKWNDTVKNADPNDPMVAAKFRQEMEPELEKFRDSFLTEGGQKWAESRVDALRNHLFEKTTADMGTLAAQAASVNMRQTSNAMSNTAMNDPSSVPHLLEGIEGTVGAMVDSSPNLKGTVAARARSELTEKMREGIVRAGAIGAIQKSANPEAEAAKWTAKYPEYINGSEALQLSRAARVQIQSDRVDRERAVVLQDKIRKETSEGVRENYLKKLYSDDPKEIADVSAKSIVNDPNLTVQDKEHLIGVVKRELKPETDAKVSERNYIGVLADIRSGKISDIGQIYEARIDGRLSKGDTNQAIKDFTDFRGPDGGALAKDRSEFFKRYAPAIDPSMGDVKSLQFGRHTALGSQKMYEAEKAARRAEEDARKAGKDPHSVYDPSSPDFFGKPANLMKYRASLQDSIKYQNDISEVALPPADKRTAGQTYPTARGPMKWTGTGWVAP